MSDPKTQDKSTHDWIQNISIGICLFGMWWVGSIAPLFGAMYEGLGNRLSVLTQLIYHPSIYWGFPILVLFTTLSVNMAFRQNARERGIGLKAILMVSLLYLTLMGAGLYLPYYQMSKALGAHGAA